ncbi:MAG TPA: hypothetical protein VGI73_01540 [Solirubrobacterales bacterium]|jgi:Tfp pilus assembly protein PilO
MASSSRLIVSILVVAVVAVAFWMLALAPKREKASELGQQVEQLQATLSQAQSEANDARIARKSFPSDYRQLVVLGQAVPAGDETSSLLVELEGIARRSKVEFESIQLDSSGEGAASSESTGAAVSGSTSPTEAAASLMPLGASIGPAGLGVMPYTLTFKGSFFHIADLIHEIDSLVRTSGSTVAVDGRLLTLSAFSLQEESERGFPYLETSFTVTSYVTPPSQGLTAGATPAEPAPTISAGETEAVESSATTSEPGTN